MYFTLLHSLFHSLTHFIAQYLFTLGPDHLPRLTCKTLPIFRFFVRGLLFAFLRVIRALILHVPRRSVVSPAAAATKTLLCQPIT